ncbi:MAG: alpha/beta hydrolase family protein [Candidatus Polarisedimenticolia bacterium]
MLRPVATFIDDYRIWYKVTFQRGRILTTRGDAWRDLGHPDLLAEPGRWFGNGHAVPDVRRETPRAGRLADVIPFSFPSPRPIEGYPYAETNTVCGFLHLCRGRPGAPAIVLSHGWAHDDHRTVERIFVEPLLEAGFSVAVVAHPFHFDRTPAGTYSGELMVTGDVVLTAEAFRQGVADLSAAVSWLRDEGLNVGVMGYSLGGYLAALVACVRDDLGAVVIGAAGDSVVSPILDTRLGVNVREDLSQSGMHARDRLETAWGIISPGRLAPRVPRERILMVAGEWDRIMLPSSVQRLQEAWGRPELRWEPQGHYTLLAVPGRLVRRSLPFLQQTMGP